MLFKVFFFCFRYGTRQAFCSVEWNLLCRFGSGHFREIILIWVSGSDVTLIFFLIFSSSDNFVWVIGTI